MTKYPTIANCNYDDTIHRARLAAETVDGAPDALDDALAELESALEEELTDSGEHRRGQVSAEIIDAAEATVIEAYGDGPNGAMWYHGRWVSASDSEPQWA